MPRSCPTTEEALVLVGKVDRKFRPAWEAYGPKEQASLAMYFLPHGSKKEVLGPTRPRILKWYCPFAAQCEFPSGHRYCINVYTGCAHACVYCYAASYAPENANSKRDFERLLGKDVEDLERFDVPPAPVHLSNSTDPFQLLEEQYGHTRMALEQILEHRRRFTTVTILTKNPLRPVELEYVDLFRELGSMPHGHSRLSGCGRDHSPGFVVEVSLAFWREEARRQYDRCAPSVAERVQGLRALRDAGIPLVLRIDPLFPPASMTNRSARSYRDVGLVEPQTLDDLEHLVALAKELKVRHVVYSAAKIVQPRGRKLSETMQALRELYESCSFPEKLDFQGGSWRLSRDRAQTLIVRPFLEICEQNLTETP